MTSLLRAFASTLGAALFTATLVTLVFSVADGANRTSVFVFFFAWFVGALHIAMIGLPAFVLLKRKSCLSWRTLALAGFAIGFVPVGIFTWPQGGSSYFSSSGDWYGHYRDFVIDGVPTIYGWLQYLQGNACFGVLGVTSALAFWRIWLWLERRDKSRASENIHDRSRQD